MTSLTFDIALSSHVVAALTFGLLTAYLLASLTKRGPGLLLVIACAATTAWAVFHLVSDLIVSLPEFYGLSQTLLCAAWMAFLMSLLCGHWRAAGHPRLAMIAPAVLGSCLAIATAIDLSYAVSPATAGMLTEWNYRAYRGIALSIVGLFLVENVYLNTLPANRWSIKFLSFALGGIFAYDFFLYAEALFSGQFNTVLFQARGAVDAMVVPLIMISAARNPNWSLDVFFSRKFAIRLFSLAGSILYLALLVSVGYLLELIGGSWGLVFRTLVLFAGAILLVSILVSGRFRSELVIFLNKNFFTYKFDYREEWLRFLKTISRSDTHPDLAVRVIQGVADIADSPGGVLWLAQPDRSYLPVARWNFQQDIVGVEPEEGPVVSFLRDKHWIVNLNEVGTKPKEYLTFSVSSWLAAIKAAWLIVPLFHRETLSGFIVLLKPRAPREINWEDRDLLNTVSAHSASYLAEQVAEKALAEARQFDAFNRRFAFVIHDIKNLVGQLSLLLDNAEKHGEDPMFRRDVIATIRNSVSKLKLLLSRLHGEGERQYPPAILSLPRLVQRVAGQMKARNVEIVCEQRCGEVWVTAHRDRLSSVFRHLVQNAIDAMPEGGRIDVIVRIDGGSAVVDVVDNGPGMTHEFVQNELFQPFKSTKSHGYGIGAYEAREIVSELGGRVEVDSTPGEGTRVSVRLPIVSAASNAAVEATAENSK